MQITTIWQICLIALGVEIVFGMAFHSHYQRRIDVFDPFYWASAVYFAVMVIAPYTWVQKGKIDWYGAPVLNNLVVATLFFGTAYFAFAIASVSKTKSKAQRLTYNPTFREKHKAIDSDPRIELISWCAFIAGMVLSLLYLRFRGRTLLTSLSLGTIGNYTHDFSSEGTSLWFLNQGTRVMMCGSLLLMAYSKRHKMLTFLAYALTFMLVLSSGKRNQLMVVVMAPIIFYYLNKGKRPKPRLIISFMVVFVFVLGVVGIWRSTFFRGGTLEMQSFSDTIESFMVNIEVFFPYYTMISTVPSAFPHQFGLSYLYTIIQFIPRALWSGKPVSAVTKVTEAMFGAYAAWGPAYPNFAEMYLDFNLPGMIIGMGIFAIVCKKNYENGTSKYANQLDIISFSLFLPYLFQYITRGHFPSVATEVFFMWGPIWVTKLILRTNILSKANMRR